MSDFDFFLLVFSGFWIGVIVMGFIFSFQHQKVLDNISTSAIKNNVAHYVINDKGKNVLIWNKTGVEVGK